MFATLAFGIVLLLVLLAIPVTFTFCIFSQQLSDSTITLGWGFGLVTKQLATEEILTGTSQAEQDKGITAKRQSGFNINAFSVITQQDFRQRIIRFLGDLWRAVHKEDVRLHMRIGLGDPADTGKLWALIGPLSSIFATLRDVFIRIEPEFQDTAFDVHSSGRIHVIPLQLIYLMITLMLSPPIWRGLTRARRG